MECNSVNREKNGKQAANKLRWGRPRFLGALAEISRVMWFLTDATTTVSLARNPPSIVRGKDTRL
jgi:hypothetical protein